MPAGFDTDDARVRECPVVGEEGIVVDVVQVRLHVLHARHGRRRRRGLLTAALLQAGEDLSRIAEGEIVQHDDDFLHRSASGARVVDDERSRQQLLFLETDMRMHPERAGEIQAKIVVLRTARWYRRRGNVRHAVLLEWRCQPVPMDQRSAVQMIAHLHPEWLRDIRHHARCSVRLGYPEHRGRFAVHLDGAGLQIQNRHRFGERTASARRGSQRVR